MKKIGRPWNGAEDIPMEPGVLYHWQNDSVWIKEYLKIGIARCEQLDKAHNKDRHRFVHLMTVNELNGDKDHAYWFRPFDEDKWEEETRVMLDLMRAGGVAVADEVTFEEPERDKDEEERYG